MKEYELYLPLHYNDGRPVEIRKLQDLLQRLRTEFGGVTYFPQPNEGLWRMGNVVYRDEIVIYRVLARNEESARAFFADLKVELMASFDQEDILIVERDVRLL